MTYFNEDNVWNRYFLPFQQTIDNLTLPQECLQYYELQKKYDDAVSIKNMIESSDVFDEEDAVIVNNYVKECFSKLNEFIQNTQMSDEMLALSIEMEKLNIRNEKVKIILKKIHPISELSDYFMTKQKLLHSKIKFDYEQAKQKYVDIV